MPMTPGEAAAYRRGLEDAARAVEALESHNPKTDADVLRDAAILNASMAIRALPVSSGGEVAGAIPPRLLELLQRWSDRSLRIRRSLCLGEGDTTDVDECRRELIEALGNRAARGQP